MKSRRLGRQIAETFGDENIEEQVMMAVAQAGPFVNPESTDFFMYFSTSICDFFERVDESYLQLESKLEIANRNIEVSSEELFQANNSLTALNQTLDAILNSLGQAILVFEKTGLCLGIHSSKCKEILECTPTGMHIRDVLRVSPSEHEFFSNWLEALFEERVEFAQLAQLGPSTVAGLQNKRVELEYRPVRNELGQISHVVLVASDKTIEYESLEKFEKMKAYVSRITQFLKTRDESIKQHEQMEILADKLLNAKGPYTSDYRNDTLRLLHTAKSLSAVMNLTDLKKNIHKTEEELRFLEGELFVQTILNAGAALKTALESAKTEVFDFIPKDSASEKSAGLDLQATKQFTEEIKMKTSWRAEDVLSLFAEHFVLEPISKYLVSFQGTCGNLADQYQKKVSPFTVIGDFKIYPSYWSDLLSAMGHIFSNIIVHGIETPSERMSRGKPEAGSIKISLQKKDENYHILIEDDGKGIDADLLLKKFTESQDKNRIGHMSRSEILQLIFSDGVTTKEQADENAGRGVGLSALRSVVEELEGDIFVESEMGRWTRFTLTIPTWKVNHL